MLTKIISQTIAFWDNQVFRSPFVGFLISLCFAVYFVITDKHNIWIRLLPFIVLCFLLLLFTIYYLWHEIPSSESVSRSTLRLRIAGLPLKRCVTFSGLVIVSFVVCLVVIYAMNKYMTVRDGGHTDVQLHVIGKEDQMMRRETHIDPVTAFSAYEFLDNAKEFKGYTSSRGTDARLNPDKLINLLYVYFRSVLLYPSPQLREYNLTGRDGALYKLEFPGHDKAGNRRSVSLGEMSGTLLAAVCSDLLKSGQTVDIIRLVDLFTRALATPSLDKSHKFNILNAENTVLKQAFDSAIRKMPEREAQDALDIRRGLALSELQGLNQTEVKTDAERESFYNIVISYTRRRIEVLIAHNKFIDIFKYLYDELKVSDDKRIVAALLNDLVINNNLFLLERKEAVLETAAKYRRLIGEEQFARLDGMINFSPANIELANFSVEPVEPDKQNIRFKGVDYQKIKTIVSFVIPYRSQKDYIKYEYPDEYTIEFIRLNSLYDDPVYLFLDSLHQDISGMPTTIFSDAVGNIDQSTIVRITIMDFFHPDFDLVEDRITYINFEETEARLGRKYYPHKDRIVEILRRAHRDHSGEIPFEIKREDINVNLISNHIVNYVDESHNSIFHKVYTITNLDSYLKVKRRYLERISELNLSDEFLDIRELLLGTEIVTAGTLREFVSRVIDLTVKKSIELRGMYRFLWKDSGLAEPLNETDIQPMIKAHLQPILEAKGIQISRETIAANGSLDFLCTYTHDGSLFKVGIEVKKAHHEKLLDGLAVQLPEYLKDEGTRHGIFLVLWFKNDKFRQPAKYESIPELIEGLEAHIPKEYQFRIIVIDGTKRPPPSKM